MTVTIALSPDVEAKLRARAAAAGKDVTVFVREAVEEKLAAAPNFRDIFAPLHEAFAQGHLPDAELDKLFGELRDEVWADKQSKKGQ